MSAVAVEKRKWTVEEYLAMERTALDKHEFFDGEVFAMAGASPEHNLVVSNLIIALGNTLNESCRIYTSDMRLFIPATGHYTYADVSVQCGEPAFTDDTPRALLNPECIFEVLSESTESYDRGKKFESYRSIPQLVDYILAAQDRVMVEHFTRQPDGTWNLRELRAGQALRLRCGELSVDSLYRRMPSQRGG